MDPLGLLGELPLAALEAVFSLLEPRTLLLLHVASATKVQAIRQRLLGMRYAQHWLKLTKRLPSVERNTWNWQPTTAAAKALADLALDDSSHVDAVPPDDGSESASSDNARHWSSIRQNDIVCKATVEALAARQLSWRPCSKHTLLQTLRQQVQHINDIAALMHYWSSCIFHSWSIPVSALGLRDRTIQTSLGEEKRLCGLEIPWDSCEGWYSNRLRQISEALNHAFLLGYDGFVDFFEHEHDPRNKWKEFIGFGHGDVFYSLQCYDVLAFVCVLYRLQQLPAEAVLARFHGMVSRLCRRDLLLLSSILQLHTTYEQHREQRAASLQEAQATDILAAFAQHEPYIKDCIASLTAADRASIMTSTAALVDDYVSNFTDDASTGLCYMDPC